LFVFHIIFKYGVNENISSLFRRLSFIFPQKAINFLLLKKPLHWFEGSMHGWVDQFGCHASQFCLVVTIAMPMSLYRFLNWLKWTWFKYLNLNIYMMHKIILQIYKIYKSNGLLNSKFINCTSNYHFYVDYVIIHLLMGCVLGIWN
jgi:hypothetical protein